MVDDAGDINLANALDLSESEEEEEMEDIIVDFSQDREVKSHRSQHSQTNLTIYLRAGSNAGSRLATRAPLLLPVPRTLPHVRLRTSNSPRYKRTSQSHPREREHQHQARLVLGRHETSRGRARGRRQGEAASTLRRPDRPARDIPERRCQDAP